MSAPTESVAEWRPSGLTDAEDHLWRKLETLRSKLRDAEYSLTVRTKELDRLRLLIGRVLTLCSSPDDIDILRIVLRDEARYK